MTTHTTPAGHSAATTPAEGQSIHQFDLSPEGLADTPAHQEDPDSLVYPGNADGPNHRSAPDLPVLWFLPYPAHQHYRRRARKGLFE
jgi:hypothetical protein